MLSQAHVLLRHGRSLHRLPWVGVWSSVRRALGTSWESFSGVTGNVWCLKGNYGYGTTQAFRVCTFESQILSMMRLPDLYVNASYRRIWNTWIGGCRWSLQQVDGKPGFHHQSCNTQHVSISAMHQASPAAGFMWAWPGKIHMPGFIARSQVSVGLPRLCSGGWLVGDWKLDNRGRYEFCDDTFVLSKWHGRDTDWIQLIGLNRSNRI